MTQTSDWENEIDEYIKEISDLKFSAKLQFRNFMTALEMDNISLGKLSDMKKQFERKSSVVDEMYDDVVEIYEIVFGVGQADYYTHGNLVEELRKIKGISL
jgi:regulator of replication initiation timing